MSLNAVPSGERIHIGIFGKRNAGKSSIINAVTGQNLSIVSPVKGTTTDPVLKTMEMLPLGPVVWIDTPGIDDEGELGSLRVKKSYQMLNKTDLALLAVDGTCGLSEEDKELVQRLEEKRIPYLVVMNKADEVKTFDRKETETVNKRNIPLLWVSSLTGENITKLKENIAGLVPKEKEELRLVGDLLMPRDFVVLVVPIDKAAPKGRLILPQQQTIRDILEADAAAIVVKEYELKETLNGLIKKPKMVITDSQVFASVSKDTPEDILLTSFSILFARYKGNLLEAVKGAKAVKSLEDGDVVLIGEGCTHHRQCDDIGTVKLPGLIRQYTGRNIMFEFTGGTEFPEDLSKYKMVVHCGGCMLNEREMKNRLQCAIDQGIPVTNYGILIAYMQGILKRSIEAFPHILEQLKEF